MRIKDIAREAGVSTATVSHVINKTKYVSDATREKVEHAIGKFNYHPNAHAQMLALGRSKMIGLLVSDISNPFFPEIIKSVEAAVVAAKASPTAPANVVLRAALQRASRRHPLGGRSRVGVGVSGRWVRRGNRIVLFGV